MDILDTNVSYLENAKTAIISKELSIRETLKRIKDGVYQSEVDALRRLLSADEKEKYSERKKLLPGVCFCGTFDGRRRGEYLKQYNRLIVIDVDKLKSFMRNSHIHVIRIQKNESFSNLFRRPVLC